MPNDDFEPVTYVSDMLEHSESRSPVTKKKVVAGQVVEVPVPRDPFKFKNGKYVATSPEEVEELESSPRFAEKDEPLKPGAKRFKRAVTADEAEGTATSSSSSSTDELEEGQVKIGGQVMSEEEALQHLAGKHADDLEDAPESTPDEPTGAPEADSPSAEDAEPITGINNRMEAIEALKAALPDVDVLEHVTPNSATDEIQAFALEHGHSITRYE